MANVFDRLDRIEKNQTQGKRDKRSALDRLDKIQPVKDTAKKVDADSLSRAKTTPKKQAKTDTTARGSKRKSFFSYDREATSGYGQANRSPMGEVPRNAVRAEKRAEYQDGEKFSVGKLAGGMAVKGATDFAKSISGTLSFLEGAVTKPLDQLMGAEGEFVKSGMFHKLNEDIKEEQEAAREYFQPNVERGGKAAEIADFLGTTTISAIPQGLMATVAGSTKAAQTGVDVVAKAKDLAPGIWNSVRSLAARSAKDPAFWSSFFQTIGNDYEEAIADGASELKAVSYAIGNGLLNAQVEVGGGLETMDEAGDMGIKALAKAAKEEGNEEVIQGIIQRGLQNLVYEKGNPIASVSDENAVLNPMTSAQEWAGGAFAGGVLSGARIGGNYLAGQAYNRQLANIGADYQVEPEALVQEGLSFHQGTEARRTAEQMQEKINSGTSLTDSDLGKMVAANEQTMYQQRQLEWANTPAEERAADGDRALLETARKMVQGRESGKDPLTEALSGGNRVNQEQLTQEQMEAWDTHNDVWVDAKDNVYQMDPTQHISQRTFEGVGDRKVNAFQFDHPELQSYYKQAAEQLVRDASLSIDAPKTTRVERGTQGKRYIHEILDTPSLRSAMDMGLSRNQVIQAAQDLIADNGQENNAAAKRLEFVLDDMLTRGYTTTEGESFGPNAAYISAKETIPGYQAEQREALPIWDMEETAQTDTAMEQDVQQRMERVRRAAGALGESGGKALTAAYTEDTAKTIAPKEAVEGFYRVYNAAMKRENLTGEGAQAAQKLPAHLRFAAESAGKQDALRARQARFFGEKAGLIKDDSWKKAHLSSKTNRTLDALGKALGVQIKFAETVAEGQANGQYVNGTITLALDGENPVMTTVTHEAVHRLREMSPEAYSALADFVRGNLSEETTDYALLKREVLNRSSDADAMTEEIVADAFGRVLNDGKAIERLVQDNRSLAEKVRDVLADIVNAVKRVLNHQNLDLTAEQKAEFRELEGRMSEMERLFRDALGKAEAQNGGKNTAQDGGTAKFSIKEDSNGKVVSDNRGWHWNDLSYRSYRGDSPMSRAGYAMMADDPHALHAYGDKVVAVRQAELKPIAEFQDKIAENWERDKENGTLPYALETDLGHLSGEEVAAAFDPDDIVDSADAWDNEDMVQWAYEKVFDGIPGVKTSDGAIVFDEGLLHSIDPESDVLGDELHGETRKESEKKFSLKEDSHGRKLTEEQQEYFRDSKVRDKDGRLMVMYHGTTKYGEITKFRKGRSGLLGPGIYLTSRKSDAQHYADAEGPGNGTLYEMYANLTNPLVVKQNNPVPEILLAAYGRDSVYKNRSAKQSNDTNIITSADIKKLQSKGYDGIQWDFGGSTECSVFQPNQIKNVTNQNPTGDPDIRRSRKEKTMLEEFRKEYGTIPKGETPSREILLPRKTAADRKVSQTVRTILEAGATPEEMVPTVEDMVAKGDFSYDAYTDKQAISDAESQIKKVGWAQALTDWTKAVKSGEVSKANTAMGWALYNNAANSGDTKTALTVLNQMVEHQRSAAQALQATRILKSMSPETQLYGVQRSVENLQEELNKRYGDKKGPDLKIDEDLAERFMKAKDQESRDEILKEIYRDIGRQMPSRFIDRWNAWRYLAMLGNTRTHVRNIVGNAGFMPVVATKNLVGTAIESAVYRVSGGKLNRSKALVWGGKQDRALLSAAWGDYAKVQEAALGSGKYSEFANANRYIEEGRKIFGNTRSGLWNATGGRALETFRKANSAALDVEDVWFSKPHYAYALSQYCKAHGITAEQIVSGKGLKAAREYAILEAQKATYRDTNALSQTISDLGRGTRFGNSGVGKALTTITEGILPFRKTPANILARGVEYSPIGLANGIKEALWDVQKGTKTGSEAIDAISAGLSGTGLLALGLYMAAQGLVRGHGGDDDKKKKFEEMQGHQAYALELPDGRSVTLDWLAPEALPFFIGVNLWEITDGERATLSDWMTSTKLVTEPLLEMSCLQSLNGVFDAVGYASSEGLDGLPAALASAGTSYLTQALPTVLGQAERTGEDKRYTTYTEKNSFLTGDIQYTLGKASARIPGWDYQQIPYIDAWGRTESSGNAGTRTFNNFVNPAYTSQVQNSAMEKELLRLYEATGESGVFPQRAEKYFTVDQERKDLTAQEYVKYATLKGQSAYQLVTDLVKDKKYQAMSDQDKAAAVENAYKLANQQAKQKVGGYKPESWIIKAAEAEKKHGIDQETYVLLKTQTAGIESLKDRDGETIRDSKGLQIMELVYGYTGLSDKQKEAMFEYLGVGKTIRHYNPGKVKQELEKMKKK